MYKYIHIAAFYMFMAFASHAQEQWRFHLAFENGDGARDTIWFLFDTTATLGSSFNPQVDTALGEGRVEMDLNAFNVWTMNWDQDSTKTVAFPYTIFPIHGAEIHAFNVQFPVILRWDTSLFTASYLPYPIGAASMYCNHFFFINNDPPLQGYNMLLDDSVVVEMMFGNDALFPLGVGFQQSNTTSLPTHVSSTLACGIFPNPARDKLTLNCPERLLHVRVLDGSGRLVLEHGIGSISALDISQLPAGLYFIEGHTNTYQRYHAKFIKED